MSNTRHPTADEINMLAAVGLVALNWEMLENGLFRLFHRFASQNRLADTQMYSGVVSFKARLDLITNLNAFRLQHNSGLQGRVHTFLERAKRLSRRRNEVLHGQMSRHQRQDGKGKITGESIVISNSLYDTDLQKMISSRYEYSAAQVREFAQAFAQCADDLDQIIDEIDSIDVYNEEGFSFTRKQ